MTALCFNISLGGAGGIPNCLSARIISSLPHEIFRIKSFVHLNRKCSDKGGDGGNLDSKARILNIDFLKFLSIG